MARKKGGGGKLNRSQIIQARLDPKLHMAAEIMARSERRTLSSLIENLVEEASKTRLVKRNQFQPWWSEDPDFYCRDMAYTKYDEVSIDQATQDLTGDHESIRFVKFASYFPDLLTKHEEEMFIKIYMTRYFWMHYEVNVEDRYGTFLEKFLVRVNCIDGIVKKNLIEFWDVIKKDDICSELLDELPVGKKIPAPLKNDPRAIKKYIRTGNPQTPFEIVYIKDLGQAEKIQKDEDKVFLKKNIEELIDKGVDFKVSENGNQLLFSLPNSSKEQNLWTEFMKKLKDSNKDGNQV